MRAYLIPDGLNLPIKQPVNWDITSWAYNDAPLIDGGIFCRGCFIKVIDRTCTTEHQQKTIDAFVKEYGREPTDIERMFLLRITMLETAVKCLNEDMVNTTDQWVSRDDEGKLRVTDWTDAKVPDERIKDYSLKEFNPNTCFSIASAAARGARSSNIICINKDLQDRVTYEIESMLNGKSSSDGLWYIKTSAIEWIKTKIPETDTDVFVIKGSDTTCKITVSKRPES